MRRRIPNRKVVARIVVTPLVDVVLVLLVLFLVLTPLLTRSIDVRKPHTTVSVPPDQAIPGSQLVVQATPDGVWINGEAVEASELTSRLASQLEAQGNTVVFFQGDAHLRYGDVVRYMDQIRASGAEILGIAPDFRPGDLPEKDGP